MPNKQYLQAQDYINSGYQHIVDIDLKNFFDEVDHCIAVATAVPQGEMPLDYALIRKWLRAPIQVDGKLVKRRKGVPQGSPLSPLLSNIMLHELDRNWNDKGCATCVMRTTSASMLKRKSQARKVGNSIYLCSFGSG
jgi:RNA-directed DNA polymerase